MPFWSASRGGDQVSVMVFEVVEVLMCSGGLLGTTIEIESWSHLLCLCAWLSVTYRFMYSSLFELDIATFKWKVTILPSGHIDSCCRSSPNTGVSCNATGVVGVWQESTQCGCSHGTSHDHWAIHQLIVSAIRTLQQVVSDDSIWYQRRSPSKCNCMRSDVE